MQEKGDTGWTDAWVHKMSLHTLAMIKYNNTTFTSRNRNEKSIEYIPYALYLSRYISLLPYW
jgi:hypothetical protein